jgi:hypothetical protein
MFLLSHIHMHIRTHKQRRTNPGTNLSDLGGVFAHSPTSRLRSIETHAFTHML